MKKKVLLAVVVFTLSLGMMACGEANSSINSATENYDTATTGEKTETTKGTRSNPYTIGETIELDDLYHYDITYDKVSITVVKKFNEEDWTVSKWSGAYYVLEYNLRIDGNYDDGVSVTSAPISIDVLSDDMVEADFAPVNVSTEENINEFYTGIDYDLYQRGKENINYKYCVIRYYTKSENVEGLADEHEVYIALD
jgi:hypothetical protein